MEVSTKRAVTYGVAGTALTTGLSVFRHGATPKALALGAATGVAAAGAQTITEGVTGSGGKGWLASIAGGGLVGTALLGSLGGPNGKPISPGQARGIGAVIGLTAGAFAPAAAGWVLLQLGE